MSPTIAALILAGILAACFIGLDSGIRNITDSERETKGPFLSPWFQRRAGRGRDDDC